MREIYVKCLRGMCTLCPCPAVETGEEWETRLSKCRARDTYSSKEGASAYRDRRRERDMPFLVLLESRIHTYTMYFPCFVILRLIDSVLLSHAWKISRSR